MEIETLFSIPVLKHSVSEKIADKVEEYFLTIKDRIPFGYDQYSDFFIPAKLFDFEAVPELRLEIESAKATFTEVTAISSMNAELQHYWVQDYSNEGLQQGRHAHGINGVSGVYWIRANESAGTFCLHNPNSINAYCEKTPQKETPFVYDEYHYKPKKGSLIMFASYLHHEVLPSGPNAIRSSLAFNFP